LTAPLTGDAVQFDKNSLKGTLFKTGDDTYQTPIMDASTRVLITIGDLHHELIEGKYWRSGMNFSLANGNVATFGFTTPVGEKEIHITWTLNTSADGTFTVLEDVTSFAGGVSISPLNQNRRSTIECGVTCLSGMTGADLITPTGGTTILNAVLSIGKGNIVSRAAGEGFIFKKGSNYLFRYTNGANANVIQLSCEWHGHTEMQP